MSKWKAEGWKVGDKIIILEDFPGPEHNPVGKIATIIDIDNEFLRFGNGRVNAFKDLSSEGRFFAKICGTCLKRECPTLKER